MHNLKRNLYNKINKLLEMFPVVAIIGSRQCGKTTLSKTIRPNWLYLDLEKLTDFNRVDLDPEFFFQQNSENVIIDEAQLCPSVFTSLRSVIDQNRNQKGRFIITGSSSPELLTNISESLAGRIATIELSPFKANEIYNKELSQFYDLFKNNLSKVFFDSIGTAKLTPQQIQNAWLLGGYPEPVLQQNHEFYTHWMLNYENSYINRDIAKLYPKLNKIAYQRFITMLCKLSSTILNKSELGRALEVSERSIREFLNIADGTFIWRQIPSYENTNIKSIVKMPKGHIRDSGLLHSLLGITNKEKLINDPIIGASWEAFVIEEIIKGLQATMITHWKPYYYRTRTGVEVDLILDGPFGVLPIEIKYGVKTNIKQLKSLEEFVVKNNLLFGLLINQSEEPYWLTKNIFQLPATYL